MREAVEAFFKNESTPQALSIVDHAVKFHIPRDTFYKYVHKDPKKQRKLGSAPGRNMKVSSANCEFFIQHTIRADRANDGFTTGQVITNL